MTNTMHHKLDSFFSKYEFVLPLIIFVLFFVAALPGIEWGAPALWNPDEMVWRVDSALRGELIFDETEPDFNYPSLPKYVMYAIGLITYGMGKSNFAFISLRGWPLIFTAISKGYAMIFAFFVLLSTVLVCTLFIINMFPAIFIISLKTGSVKK